MKLSILTMTLALLAAFPLTANAFDNDKVPALQNAAETVVETVTDAPEVKATMEKADAMEDPAIKAVVFYSDSCGSCKILEPRVKEAMGAINQDRVEVIKLDFSNKDTIEATKTLATTAGVNDILQEYGAKSGFVVLVNKDGEVIEKLTKKDETSDIAGKLAMSIAKSAS